MLVVRSTPRALARSARTLPARALAVRTAALPARSTAAGPTRTALPALARSFHASPLALGMSPPPPSLAPTDPPADEVVKVPSMAESITEGTLKQWLKQKGDYVEADEEVATIETDKIDVAVNAPKAGTITELLAAEEDTVTVGQDLFKLDSSGAKPEGGAAKDEPAPKEDKKDESAPAPKKEDAIPEAKSEYRKPDSAQPAPKVPEPSKKQEGKTAPEPPAAAQKGSRNETR
ncbi:hypothetical protein JCM3770_003157, partial [Rhodotorula araucariae]